jgi:replicative DNA helicase
LPLWIDDTASLTIAALAARARRMKRRHGIKVLIVDYLQLLRGAGRIENRTQEVSEITRALKGIAKDLRIAVIALSQLSRQVESREDKRPMLSDLRESGSIEQDADAVMFAYREQYYLDRAEPAQRPDEDSAKFADRHARWQQRCEEAWNTMDVIIAKQRHGPIGSVKLAYFADTNTVSSLAGGARDGSHQND